MTRPWFPVAVLTTVSTLTTMVVLILGARSSVDTATPRATSTAMTTAPSRPAVHPPSRSGAPIVGGQTVTVMPPLAGTWPLLADTTPSRLEHGRASRSARVASPALARTAAPTRKAPHPFSAPTGNATAYPMATRIADCESGERLANGRAVHYSFAVHAQDPRSSASGKYSFVDGTWHDVTGLPGHAKDYSEAVQDAAFDDLWDDGRGASHWRASRSCWRWAR